MTVDILEISKNAKAIIAIDYFSRVIYGKMIKNKRKKTILNFLKKVNEELCFESIYTDNGKEFVNDALKEWLEENNKKHRISVPYYHESNGRIERANRTIRTALKKTKGRYKKKLENIIFEYNNIHHRAIGMKPFDALKKENQNKVMINQEKYAKEFSQKVNVYDEFSLGEKVLIKNECRKTKMDKLFKDVGVIDEILSMNTYRILNKKNKNLVRHASQLRRLEKRDVDCKFDL